MYRRRYLAALGTVGLAGCSGSTPNTEAPPTDTPPPTDGDGGPTPTPTKPPMDSPTPTATSEPEPPEIMFVNLISSFDAFGDVAANNIDSQPQGAEVLIGYRYEAWVHDGTFSITTQVEITDQDGNRVAIDQDVDEQIIDGNGPRSWEGAMGFHASWDPGTYTAEVVIRDDVTEKVSDSATGTFEITKPEPKLEITREERYTDDYDSGVRGVARNVADSTLAYAEVSAVFLDDAGRQIGDGLDNTNDLSPGREWQFDISYYGDEDFASYELSVDWRVD